MVLSLTCCSSFSQDEKAKRPTGLPVGPHSTVHMSTVRGEAQRGCTN